MELKKGEVNIIDLRYHADPKPKTPLTFDSLRNRLFKRTSMDIGHAFIVRCHRIEDEDWVEVCGEIIWGVNNDPSKSSYVGLEMYYDDRIGETGFSDAVRVPPLPENMKGVERDRGIGQIMYQRSHDFMRFGFPDLVKENDDAYLDISWKRHFREAGYQIVGSIRPVRR